MALLLATFVISAALASVLLSALAARQDKRAPRRLLCHLGGLLLCIVCLALLPRSGSLQGALTACAAGCVAGAWLAGRWAERR